MAKEKWCHFDCLWLWSKDSPLQSFVSAMRIHFATFGAWAMWLGGSLYDSHQTVALHDVLLFEFGGEEEWNYTSNSSRGSSSSASFVCGDIENGTSLGEVLFDAINTACEGGKGHRRWLRQLHRIPADGNCHPVTYWAQDPFNNIANDTAIKTAQQAVFARALCGGSDVGENDDIHFHAAMSFYSSEGECLQEATAAVTGVTKGGEESVTIPALIRLLGRSMNTVVPRAGERFGCCRGDQKGDSFSVSAAAAAASCTWRYQ